jgi:FkbM family methyltransferase
VRDTPLTVRLAQAVIPRLPLARYRLARAVGRLHRTPFRAAMPERVGGLTFQCDLRDAIARDVCFTGLYEPQETALVTLILAPGMTFVDVGAHWGYFTLMAAARVGLAGRVISLEPDPRSFARLRSNVEHNRLSRVHVLPVAAADVEATVSLRGYEEGAENCGVSRVVAEVRATGPAFQVAARPLDDIARELGVDRVDLMKMDVEGGEATAISGMRGLLAARSVRRLLLELHPQALAEGGLTLEDVYGPLRRAGYQGFTIDHSPATTRRLAYGRRGDGRSLLTPVVPGQPLDAWPHQLWLAPGSRPPC